MVLPSGLRVPLPCAELPELVLQAVGAIEVRVLQCRVEGLSCRERQHDDAERQHDDAGAGGGTHPHNLTSSPQALSLHLRNPTQAHDSATMQEQVAAWKEERKVRRPEQQHL